MAQRLARAGSTMDGLLWYVCSRLPKSVRIPIRPGGRNVDIRTRSPDLEVALSCFEGEFQPLIEAMPGLKGALIVDAGGYIGTAAIVFAEAYPEATIVTLEPSSENFEILKRNVARYPNIKPVKKALSTAPATLTLNNRGTGQWGFTLVEKPADREASRIEEVECTTVDELMATYGADRISILKMDIEGGEHALLKGDTSWVGKADAICIELHDRIVPGCSELYGRAVAGRRNTKLEGEKYLSLAH
jgi:FkbM family methyltransferase